jgi:hypothetical protein
LTCNGGQNNGHSCHSDPDCPGGSCADLGAYRPPVAYENSAFWTGSRMIIWGGYSGVVSALYDPLSDTWKPTSLVNAPSARQGHSAVWTGSELIVWGGATGSGPIYTTTGGRYDPVADHWTSTSTSGAPVGRMYATTVWTGHEMIVWGGGIGIPYSGTNTGGRYRPDTDTWTATSTGANVPSPRAAQPGVWTGMEMFTWGLPAIGGRYCAVAYCAVRWYHDGDGDGYGNPGDTLLACTQPAGYIAVAGDCNDTSADSHPGGVEVCGDSLDNDCDGTVDNGIVRWYRDGDGDGYGNPADSLLACTQPAGYIAAAGDCNDGSADSHPGGVEVCDSLDNDCDGTVDNNAPTWYRDADGDGYGVASTSIRACTQPPGYVAIFGDCNDTSAAAYPGAPELCDSLDNDCNGIVDDNAPTWYRDTDGDGYGLLGATERACAQPLGYVAHAGDCNDGNPDVHPGALELTDCLDNDCDGTIDDGLVPVGSPILSIAKGTVVTISWTSIEGATAYDLVRGNLPSLASSHGDFTLALRACLGDDLTEMSRYDAGLPAAGNGQWYLVRGVNCKGAGTYDSGAASQVGSRDAEILASPSACP